MAGLAVFRYDGRGLVAVLVPELHLELFFGLHGGAHLREGKGGVFDATVQGVHVAVGSVEDFVLESPIGNEDESVVVMDADGVAVFVKFVRRRRSGNGTLDLVEERHGGEYMALDAAPDRLVALVEEGDLGRSLGGVLPRGEAAVHDVIGAGHDAIVFVALDVRKTEAVAAFVHIGAERGGGMSVLDVSPAGIV